MRILAALALLAVAAFCGFGFLATFEAPGFTTLRLVYAVVGALSFAGAGAALLTTPRRP